MKQRLVILSVLLFGFFLPATADDVIQPEEVANLMVSQSGNDVVLSWDGVTLDILGNAESVGNYRVYRGTLGSFVPDKAGDSNLEGTPAGTGFTDTGAVVDPDNYGQPWLAAFSPVRGTSWVAIVQEPKKRALQPVVKLERELHWYFWLGLSICCGLIAASWFFALRGMNDHNTTTARS